MRSLAIRLGVIVLIVVGAFVLRPFLTGNAGDLNVGDCFDQPTSVDGTVEDVQHRPCTDPHDAEVVFVGDYKPETSDYPTDESFQTYVGATCAAAFYAYTGLVFLTDPTYDMGVFTPTAENWADGVRKVTCSAVRIDEAKLKSSIKKT